MPDFNAPRSTEFNAGRSSLLNARRRFAPILFFDFSPAGGDGHIEEGVLYTTNQQKGHSYLHDPDWGRESFTIRLWFYCDDTTMTFQTFHIAFHLGSAVFQLIKAVFNPNSPDVHPQVPRIRWLVTHGGSPSSTEVTMTDLGAGEVGTGTFLSSNAWHRVICWYDSDALEIGLTLDDETPSTASITQAIPAGESPGFVLGSNDSLQTIDVRYDEVSLSNRHVWTEAERDGDWNAGVGLGWPDVLANLSRRPMAYWRMDDGDIIDNELTIAGVANPGNRPKRTESIA